VNVTKTTANNPPPPDARYFELWSNRTRIASERPSHL